MGAINDRCKIISNDKVWIASVSSHSSFVEKKDLLNKESSNSGCGVRSVKK